YCQLSVLPLFLTIRLPWSTLFPYTTLFRSSPVIFIGKAAARPPQIGNLQFLEGFQYIITESIGVGYIRILSDPQSTVHARTQMLDRKSTRLTPVTFRSRMPSSA